MAVPTHHRSKPGRTHRQQLFRGAILAVAGVGALFGTGGLLQSSTSLRALQQTVGEDTVAFLNTLVASSSFTTADDGAARAGQQQQLVMSPEQIEAQFDEVNAHLLGPEFYGDPAQYKRQGPPMEVIDAMMQSSDNDKSALAAATITGPCGFQLDCPQHYTVHDIERSIDLMEQHAAQLVPRVQSGHKARSAKAAAGCTASRKNGVLESGGWCLDAPGPKQRTQGTIRVGGEGGATFDVPPNHVRASGRVVSELLTLIRTENITSINDFGAGVGQYKDAVLKQIPDFNYRAYDGAGNIVNYTHGFLEHFDLTIPLALPVTDWLISLEVGEHVPSQFEGMVLRNIHRHNCKGVILSWARLLQKGHSHVNNHGNTYIVNVMESLGYMQDVALTQRLRVRRGNLAWLTQTTFAFRRKVANKYCQKSEEL